MSEAFEALSYSLAPLGRGLGRGARVRKRWCHALPPPRPSPRGGGRKSGRPCLAPSPSGGGLGWGHDTAPFINKRQVPKV